MKTIIFKTIACCLAFFLSGCEKFVDIESPKSEIVRAAVFENDATALAAIRAIYIQMMSSADYAGGPSSLSNLCGLSSAEFNDASNTAERLAFYNHSLNAQNLSVKGIWEREYKYIYYANAILEGLQTSDGVTLSLKKQLQGEAKLVRAFCHFNLVNLFGDVPLIQTTDYRLTSVAKTTPAAAVYQQIILDLKAAQSLLIDDFSFALGERIRPNKGVASALLARAYLYTGDWKNAELNASVVLENPVYKLESDLNKVFLKNSTEAIWQLMPVVPGNNTYDGMTLIPATVPQWVTLSDQLQQSFESTDQRKTNWIGLLKSGSNNYYYPLKYKIRLTGQSLTEYTMVLRLAEQFLIRAEARARQDNLKDAIKDLDQIRDRAGLPLIKDINPQIGKTDLINSILAEKKHELFSEWGHIWMDMKRLGNTTENYPIPESEVLADPNLK